MTARGERLRGLLALVAVLVAPAKVIAEEAPAVEARAIDARPRLELTVSVEPARRALDGTARWSITNRSQTPLPELLFWLYPNTLSQRPTQLGDVNFHWLYPRGFSPASMTVGAARVQGSARAFTVEASPAGARTLVRVPLAAPLPPHATVDVDLAFSVALPDRLGNFGCDGDRCRLMGGFYPFPVAIDGAGYALDAPPARIDFRARVHAPPGADVLLGDGGERDGAGNDVPYVNLIVDRGLHSDVVTRPGFSVRYLHPGDRPPSSSGQLLPYVREDRVGLVLATVGQALEFLNAEGVGTNPTQPPVSLTLVTAPLRHQLVSVHGSLVLVSDRLFEIFPLERVRKYHHLELLRAVLTAALDQRLRAVEPDADVGLSAEVVAATWTAAFTVRRFSKLEFARDLLRPLSFLPAVDQLMYAPLVPSSSSYFGDGDERDALRDDVRTFAHQRQSGRFVQGKLIDLLGPAGMTAVARLIVGESVPLRQAAERVFGAPLDWFWRQWATGPPPRTNYRLTAVRTSPLSPRGVHVEIEVARQGADVREPVETEVVDRDGARHPLIWNDGSDRHRFDLDLPAGLASVEVDPRHRLTESAVGALHPAEDPLSDNRTPKRWRFLYTGFGALLDVTNLQASLAAAVTMKPQHDLRNSIALLATHTQAVDAGLSAAYERHFGRQADSNRLTSGAGFGLSVQRPNPDFGVAPGEAPQPGWRLSANLLYEHDDRDYLIDPWRAVGVSFDVGYTLTALENGERLSQVQGRAEFLRLFELAPGHVLGIDLDASVTAGDIRKRSQLYRLGGASGLRGYGVDELLGRARAAARVELRNRYVSDLDWNLGHFTAVRALGGNLFVEAGVVSSCSDLSVGGDDVFYDVGYSFRVLHDAFGVHQQLLTVDFAVPLNRHDRVCFGQHSAPADGQPSLRRPPFVVLISFLPNF
ncbi:MAG TPA: hypothetical protein VHU40_04230 [Polyangia bacterium]|nr:hypothetical protein [Polyangia bacterium]